MEATKLRDAAARYFTKKLWAVHFEVGLKKGGGLRADVMALNLGALLTMVECKSSVQDFRSDKKWQSYLQYCDKLYFAMDDPTYQKVKDQIPKGVGIMVVAENGWPRIMQSASYHDIDDEIRMDLILRMAYRSADRTRYQIKSRFKG